MFPAFEEIQAEYINAAKEWVSQPDIQVFKSTIDSFAFEQLVNEHAQINQKTITESPVRTQYNEVRDFALKATLAENITKEAKEFPSAQFKQIFNNIGDVTSQYYYRVLALLDCKAENAPTSWITKSLCQHDIYSSFEGTGLRHEKDKFYNSLDTSNMEARTASRIHELGFGARIYSFHDSEKYPLDKHVQAFLDADEIKELTELLTFLTKGEDGRYKTMPRKDIENNVIAKALTRVTGRSDIGQGDIKQLKERGHIKATSLWNTNLFNREFDKKISLESIESAKTYNDSYFKSDHVIHKVKDNLSKAELFNFFINQHLDDIGSWESAIKRYAAFTGEKLTLKEASSLNPRHGFQLSWTKAFSDLTDKAFDANKYQTFNIEVTENDEDFDTEDNEDYVFSTFCIESQALYLDDIKDAMGNLTLEIEEGDSTSGGGDVLSLTFELDKDELDVRIPEIKQIIAKKMQSQIDNNILPGDVVMIIDPEDDAPASEYGLTAGKKVLVTDMHGYGSGEYKIKGNRTYHSSDLFDLRKKHVPKNELSDSLAL